MFGLIIFLIISKLCLMNSTSISEQFPEPSHTKELQNSQLPLKKFKPWVYRPKKVIYSLEAAQPARKPFSTSHWSQEQNKRYSRFLTKFKAVIEGSKKERRKWHLNRVMSKEVGTRSHEQCRSHHQKMLKNYKNVEGILQHLQREDEQRIHSEVEVKTSLKEEEMQEVNLQAQLQSLWPFENPDQSSGIRLTFHFNFDDSLDYM